MATAINVTFKNNEQEMKLYLEAISHSGRVCWIKDCIEFYMKYNHLEKEIEKLNN